MTYRYFVLDLLEALSTSLTKVFFQTSLSTDYDYILILIIRCLLDFSRLTVKFHLTEIVFEIFFIPINRHFLVFFMSNLCR
jgi:hypothetical protein